MQFDFTDGLLLLATFTFLLRESDSLTCWCLILAVTCGGGVQHISDRSESCTGIHHGVPTEIPDLSDLEAVLGISACFFVNAEFAFLDADDLVFLLCNGSLSLEHMNIFPILEPFTYLIIYPICDAFMGTAPIVFLSSYLLRCMQYMNIYLKS